MKVDFASLVRTHLGFPSEWEGKTTEGKDVKLSYRCGKTKLTIDGKLVATLSIDQFDIGGYMEDDVLQKLLKDNGYLE
jgi:hypothetical protein